MGAGQSEPICLQIGAILAQTRTVAHEFCTIIAHESAVVKETFQNSSRTCCKSLDVKCLGQCEFRAVCTGSA